LEIDKVVGKYKALFKESFVEMTSVDFKGRREEFLFTNLAFLN